MASELAPAASLSDLSSRFDALASRIRRIALLRGLGRVALIAAVLCGLGLLADWLWPLPQTARMGWLALTLGAIGYTLWTMVVRPVFRQFTVAELAAIVESHYPELGERLTSAVELTDPTIPESEKGSALMREWLEAQTVASTKHINFRKAVSSERATKSAWVGVLAALVLLVPFLAMPSSYGQLWARLFMPWGAHELPAVLYFHVPEGDRVVARGEDLTLFALPPADVLVKDLPDAVELVWRTPAGETHRRAMDYDAQQNAFATTLPHVFEGFEYVVTAKRKRSDRHTITVVDRPEIIGFTLTITPPQYTGLEAHTIDGAVGNVEAFERSRVQAVLEFNKPLAEAHWLWRDAEAEAASRPTTLPFELSEDKKSATLDLVASEGWFATRVADEHGLWNLEEPPRHLIVVADEPPELALSGQIDTTRARKEDVITIQASASDDLAVSALELHIETTKGHTEVQETPAEELDVPEARHTFRIDLAALDLADGEWLKYRVRAADNRPIPGPNEVWSDEQRIIIDPEADLPGSEEITNRQNEWRDILEAIRGDLHKNLQQTEKLLAEAEAQKANAQPLDKQAELTELEKQQRELSDRLEALAVQFGGHRLFSNLTPETQRIAREPIHEAAESLQQVQEQDDLARQTETLQKSEQALAKADADLEKLAKRFDDLAELERDLQVVPRLAQQAERVADQALELAKRRDNPPAEETPEQQAAREAELAREEGLLGEERQRLADDLDELLKHRPEILEAARKTALEQIEELSQQAARLADRQDALTESLKSEADQTAQDAAPIANRQAELVKKAEALKPAETNPGSENATPKVTPLDPEELRKVLEELKAGNLDAAADRQEALADRLDALAAELKKNQHLPADPQKAAEALAHRQRELQKQIADAAKNAPPENATADEQEAFENTLRKLAEQQTGIQAGIAQLDPPASQREPHQNAAGKAAESAASLIKNHAEHAEKTAQEAAEALEQLAKNIGTPAERKAEAQKAVETLRKQQNELAKDVADAAQNKTDPETLAKRQKDIAERLTQLDAPGAEENLREAVRQSAQALADLEKERLQQAEASQNQAEQALADLENKLAGKPSAREQVETLQKRQKDIAEQVQAAEKAQDDQKLAEQAAAQKQQAQALENLETPAAEPQRQAAKTAAQNAAKSLEDPTPAQTQAALDEASEALDRLKKALKPEPSTPPADPKEQLAKANPAEQNPPPKPLPKPDEVEQLAQEARAVVEEISDLQKEKAAQQPEQVAQTEPPAHPGTNPPAQPAESGNPPAKNQDPNPQRASDPLSKDQDKNNPQRNLSDPKDSNPNPSDPKDSEMNPSETNPSRPEQSPAPLPKPEQTTPAPKPENSPNAQDAKSPEKNAAQPEENKPSSNPSPENDSHQNPQRAEETSSKNPPGADPQRAKETSSKNPPGADPQRAKETQTDKPTAGQSLAERQAEQAQKAAQLAIHVAQDQGADAPATKAAAEAARKASAAREQTKDGALETAAQTAKAAAESGKSAAEELTKNAAGKLAQEAGQLAKDQAELAQALAEAAANPAQRQAAQKAGQAGLEDSSQKLASDLAESARKLASTPLELPEPSEKTEAAGQAAAQATEEMKQAKTSATQGNAAQAAKAGEKASEALRRAAGQSPAPPAATPENTLVPGDLAEQVADARRRLEEAREQLQNAQKEPPPPQTAEAPMPPPAGMKPGDEKEPMNGPNNNDPQPGQNQPGQNQPGQNQPGQNQPGQNQPGQNQPGQNQPGQNQPGQDQPGQDQPGQNQPGQNQPGQNQPGQNQPGQQSALAQSAQTLQQAAKSLSQAAQQLQGGVPGDSSTPGQASNSSDSQGQPSESGSEGRGSSSPIPIEQLEAVLKSQSREEWGQLPGQLRTEILQGNKQKTEGDYARLIELYSEELLKKQQAEPRQK